MEYALSKAVKGTSRYHNLSDDGDGFEFTQQNGLTRIWPSFNDKGKGYMGSHNTECGERSDNYDYLLENGMITNSLAPFYLKWYRYSIPESEMKKVNELYKFYKN